jgi:IMP dehydrogenase
MPPSSKITAGGLTFDDVLLLPGESTFAREQVDLSTQLHPRIALKLPILSSPMDTVTEAAMAAAMAAHGGLGVIHRNLQIDAQRAMVQQVKEAAVADAAVSSVDARERFLVAAAVGAGADLQERVQALVRAEADMIVVDSGHGHSSYIADAVRFIKQEYGDQVVLMAGNVATADGAKYLIDAGADVLRVGVGPGSICTTRIITGMGVPQLTALLDVAGACAGSAVTFVADGGIRQMGDMAKALATGASAVMLGSMLAGHDEAPGETVSIENKQFKQYRGMGSVGAMQKGGAERYGQNMKTEASKLIAEGVEGLVPAKGATADFLFQCAGSLRSAFYYTGAQTMPAFHDNARFVRITLASMQESHPHTITLVDAGGNYRVG